MSWLTDNLGYIALFVIVLLVLLGIFSIAAGKFPLALDFMRGIIGGT